MNKKIGLFALVEIGPVEGEKGGKLLPTAKMVRPVNADFSFLFALPSGQTMKTICLLCTGRSIRFSLVLLTYGMPHDRYAKRISKMVKFPKKNRQISMIPACVFFFATAFKIQEVT